MPSIRLVKRLSGDGKVFSGEKFVATSGYSLDVYQMVTEGHTLDGSSYKVPGKITIKGILSTLLPSTHGRLTLVTEEGHKANFYVINSDGAIALDGPILDKDGKPVQMK